MGACASRPKEENGPSPVAPPTEDSSIHNATTNPTEVKVDATDAPLVNLSETKPEETPVEVSTPTAVKELVPVSSKELAGTPESTKEEEKAQDTVEAKAGETEEEESKATTD